MEPPLIISSANPERHVFDLSKADITELRRVHQLLGAIFNFRANNQEDTTYLSLPCKHYVSVISDGQFINDKFTPADPNYFTTKDGVQAPICKQKSCKREITHLLIDRHVVAIGKTALNLFSQTSRKLLKEGENSSVDLTELYVLAVVNKNTFTLSCGHSISLRKLATFLKRTLNVNETQHFRSGQVNCDSCGPLVSEGSFAIPNDKIRKMAALIDEYIQTLPRINVFPPPPSSQIILPSIQSVYRANEKNQLQLLISLVRDLNYAYPERHQVNTIFQVIHGLVDRKQFEAWAYIVEFYQNILNSGNPDLLTVFFEKITQIEHGPIKDKISSLLLVYLQTQLFLFTPDLGGQNNKDLRSRLLYTIYLATYSKFCVPQEGFQSILGTILTPHTIFVLSKHDWEVLDKLQTNFPFIVEHLTFMVPDYPMYVGEFTRWIRSSAEKLTLEEQAAQYTELLQQLTTNKPLIRSLGLHIHLFHSLLIDQLDTVLKDCSPEFKFHICSRLLTFSSEPSVIDLKLLSRIHTLKEAFDHPQILVKAALLFSKWLERCIELVKDPADLPIHFRNLEGLQFMTVAFARVVGASKLVIETERKWTKFLASSKDPAYRAKALEKNSIPKP